MLNDTPQLMMMMAAHDLNICIFMFFKMITCRKVSEMVNSKFQIQLGAGYKW